ncbi:MAG: hypothetical protein C1O27_001886 [Chloroflexi bacterium]|nr:MAG: hypothetical protein C1O27_001886 [Chloroflexota bacterium]
MAVDTGARVGEVVEASTDSFVAQAYRLYEAPPLGALVRTGSDTPTFGVICYTTTRGVDPNRRPIARGEHLADEASVYQENPQLELLLKTEFNVVIIGHEESGSVRHYLPPGPPRIHAFVHQCTDEEVRKFTQDLGFLELLLNSRNASDDATSALVRQAALCHEDSQIFLVRAGKELAMLLQGQGMRLNGVLRRLG